MSDLISRQAAIEALSERPIVWDEWTDEYSLGQRNQYDDDKSAIEALPSAQSEKTQLSGESTTKDSTFDCISRQAAIDFIDAGRLCDPNEPRWSDNEIVNFLKSRPSAQPQWIPVTKEEMFKAGYEGREIRFRVDGRLFAIRELAQ